jgi:hypothetical protein
MDSSRMRGCERLSDSGARAGSCSGRATLAAAPTLRRGVTL